MPDKQKAIEDMANICFEHRNEWSSHKQGFCYAQAEALYEQNIGNIPQALMEFAEYLDCEIIEHSHEFTPESYDAARRILKDTLKEFLPNANLS